jgi:PQQ-like domain
VQEARVADGVCAVILRKRRPTDQRISFSLTLINAEDGSRLGESETGFDVLTLAKPQIVGTMVLIHSLSPGRLIGFTVANPRVPAFERSFDNRLASAPLVLDDQRVAIVTRESAIEVLQLSTGNRLDKFPIRGGVLSDRVFPTDKTVIYCDSSANVVAIDAASGGEVWRHAFDRRDLIMQRSLTTSEAMIILHKSQTASRQVIATALALETGEVLWSTDLGEDLRFDCQASILTDSHLVLAMRKIEARTVDRNGRPEHEVIANLKVHVLSRSDGALLQTLEPELGSNLVPSVIVHDGSLFISADHAILRYSR